MVKVMLASLFVTCLVVSNIISSKIVGWGPLIFPAGVIAYSITFLITDIYTEFFGKKETEKLVIYGFISNILMIILIFIAISMPIAPFMEDYQAIYEKVLGMSFRIVVASMIAYIIAQSHDVFAYHFWGKLTKGKHLWLRNNASTLVSQLIDTSLFITVAFYGVVPTQALINLIFYQYLMKALIALVDTPFCYIGVIIIRKITNLKPIWIKELTLSH